MTRRFLLYINPRRRETLNKISPHVPTAVYTIIDRIAQLQLPHCKRCQHLPSPSCHTCSTIRDFINSLTEPVTQR